MKLGLLDLDLWQRAEAILDQALELPGAEQRAFLDQVCSGDPELRAEVDALLAADGAAGGFLSVPAGDYVPELLIEDAGEEEDLAGCQVGPYRLLRQIGDGGMGTVYEAEDTRLGRRVAVKLLPPEAGRESKAKKRFLREARAASAVDHPNLCTVHDVGESDGRLYIVLTYYEGETLRERIQRGPLPFAEARTVAIQVARGLARAHEAGIIHRDVKPSNVMLTRRGEVKILDFGIARLGDDDASLTRTGAIWGTPAYMSPEQARGEPAGRSTDVWALGVLLYEMITGRRPFGGEGVQAILSSILTQEPAPLECVRPDVPQDLARVTGRALAKDPAERHADAAELLADLETGSVPIRRSRPKRLRVSWLAGGAAILGLVIAITTLWWRPWHAAAGPPIRVAILRPIVTGGNNPELTSVASEVVEASLATLVSLEGLQPLDPPERDEESGSASEKLRAADANQALLPLLDCRGDWCQVRLRLLREPEGTVLATVGPFEVQTGIENASELARGVRVHLQQIYPAHRPRQEPSGGEVRPQDYSAYIELERRVDGGERLGADELARLDALLRTSPGLAGAYRLAADIARLLGRFDRALDYAAQAEKLAPRDPWTLITRARVEMQANRLEAAGETLKRLESLAPGDTRVQSTKADLLAAQGELEAARSLREKIAQRRPTWLNILDLVTLEFRLGASDSARRRLGKLLEEQSDNQFVREHLAALEASSGDLNRAAALYEELIRIRPARPYLSNLGYIRYILGDYVGAAAADRQAITLEPAHLLTQFNLANALEAQGAVAGARHLYGTLEKELAAALKLPDARLHMLYALCLARLGQRNGADHLAAEVLKHRPEDVQVLYLASQLYALLGERISALFYAEQALKKDLRREWFTVPEFHSLKEDPDFRVLLDRAARKTS